jgi:hypothetical protein
MKGRRGGVACGRQIHQSRTRDLLARQAAEGDEVLALEVPDLGVVGGVAARRARQ